MNILFCLIICVVQQIIAPLQVSIFTEPVNIGSLLVLYPCALFYNSPFLLNLWTLAACSCWSFFIYHNVCSCQYFLLIMAFFVIYKIVFLRQHCCYLILVFFFILLYFVIFIFYFIAFPIFYTNMYYSVCKQMLYKQNHR